MNDYDDPMYLRIPLEDLKTPKPGRLCVGPRYWAIHDGDALFYRAYSSPQCNVYESIVRRLAPGLDCVFVEMAFVPHRCQDCV